MKVRTTNVIISIFCNYLNMYLSIWAELMEIQRVLSAKFIH